ncbi:MAG: hypothetical protein IJ054_05610 [Lachnospiraceae bacterium]|nr:hypothetical protein [Lachnospiraceae bacterium]
MNNSIFREKTLERVSSPEELNDYIKVTSPRVWIVMAAILLLLIGMTVWGILGTVDVIDAAGNVTKMHPISFIFN